jgi:hypothetical protein
MGVDPAWGSSASGIVVTIGGDHIIQILHAEEYRRPDYNEMLSVVYREENKPLLVKSSCDHYIGHAILCIHIALSTS